ncbi:MAG TPA: efflux RND transporter periplasmic adaptor subunit [Vicinamibacteria bacterium]|jgi:RND family efflux transporter MFP subunit|nr:efflux RND transporter periplasmic adaptor subunit [Vicinamibacteria bacterium]
MKVAEDSGEPEGAQRPFRSWSTVVIVAILLVGSLMVPRLRARAALGKETLLMAVPTVSVVHPRRAPADQEVILPANIQAYTDAPIYARTNGYLKRWHVDIGAHVVKGQLLAEIDTPEIDQQLQQTRADLATAEANARLAEITALRYRGLLKTDSVSTQDADNANGDFEAKRAMTQSARANLQRLEDLHSFQKIFAPFDGVITARNTDIGALIDSGSSGGAARELFHIASTSKLRVYVNVPQVYSQAAKPGLSADLTLAEFPGRRFQGTLVRTAEAIDTASRTLLVQIDVANPSRELLTGAFAQVHLKLPTRADSYLLPVNAVVFRSEGVRVATVKEGKSALVPVVLGRDFGTEVEVLAGLAATDDVIENPPDSLVSGQEVTIAAPSAEGAR